MSICYYFLIFQLLILRICYTSIISHRYFKKDFLLINHINHTIQMKDNSTNMITFTSNGDIYSCMYSVKYSCQRILNTQEKFFFLNYNDELVSFTKNNFSKWSQETMKIDYSYGLELDDIDSAIYLNNNTILMASRHNFTIMKIRNKIFNVKTLSGHTDIVESFAQLSNGLIVSGSRDSTIKVWDPDFNFNIIKTLTGHSKQVNRLFQLSNGMLVSGSKFDVNQTINIWDANNNFNLVTTLNGYSGFQKSLIQLSNGFLVAGSSDLTLKVWDSNNNFNLITNFSAHQGYVSHLLELSNGMLVSGSNSEIKVWDTKDNFNLVKILKLQGELRSILQLSDGMLVSCGGDNQINLWNTQNNYTLESTLTGSAHYEGGLTSLLELSNGILVSGGGDGKIQVWNLKNNYELIITLQEHKNWINSLLKLSNGYLVSGSSDNTIIIWDPNENFKIVETFCAATGGEFFIKELLSGKFVSFGADKFIGIWELTYTFEKKNYVKTFHNNSINKLIKVNQDIIFSYDNESLCKNKYEVTNKNIHSSICKIIPNTMKTILAISEKIFVSSDVNGYIYKWETEMFDVILTRHISEILGLPNYEESTFNYFITHMIKLKTGEILCALNSNHKIILNEIKFDLIFLDDNLIISDLVEYINLESGSFMSIHSNGIVEYYKFSPTLYLNRISFEDVIEIKNALHPVDYKNNNQITLDSIPKCLILLDGNIELTNGDIIEYDQKLNYKINHFLNCGDDPKIILSTNHEESIKSHPIILKLQDPPTYSITEIEAKEDLINIFETKPLHDEIKKIKFKKLKHGKIKYKISDTLMSVEFDKEYETNIEFFFFIDFEFQYNSIVNIPFIIKDKYGISSDIIILKIFIQKEVTWWKRWYSVLIMVFAVLGGLYGFFKWINSKKHLELWKYLKEGLRCIWKWLISKILCCCFSTLKDENIVTSSLLNNHNNSFENNLEN